MRRTILLLFAIGTALRAQAPSASRPQKTAVVTRVHAGSISIDGSLNDAGWSGIAPLTDFVQKDPVENAEPTDRLEVRLAYDDDALYVATRVTSRDPSKIQAPMSRRDNIHQADHIWISLDTYHDRRTAYSFAVAASGVRGDWIHPGDDENDIDASFDPVWQAAAKVDGAGWSGEMRIPFSQLRFNAADEQVWGVNFDSWQPARNEDVFWIPVPRKESGWSSWMGTLRGISGIKPTRRIEVMPYVASNSTVNAERDKADPFDNGRNIKSRAGADLKMGLGPNLTLEATVNPDFGQVEADPAEVNLSAFETFFDEKRPFFIEGSQILDANGSNYFYSRRIGARPRGAADGDFVRYPESSTIWSAAKLTGQLSNRTSLGVLTAVTGGATARTYDATTLAFADTQVAPVTAYGVGRVSRQFGANQSQVGAILTGVHRAMAANSPFRSFLNDDAITGGLDWDLRFKGNTYLLSGYAGFSHVMGDSIQIAKLQRSSARYFQRPDAGAYHFDGSRTSLTGGSAGLQFEKNTGKHWLYSTEVGTESPSFELNDIGRISTADGIFGETQVEYRETMPGTWYRRYSMSLRHAQERNYDGDLQTGSVRADAGITFTNFWTLSLSGWHDFAGQDERATRGGPSMGHDAFNVAIVSLSNAASSRTRWNGRVYYGKTEFGAIVNRLSGRISFKPGPRWDLQIEPNFLRDQTSRQYVTTRPDGSAATYGNRYVFAFLDRSSFVNTVRLNYTLKPDLTLELYGEPFAASGRYLRFGELEAPRAQRLRWYGTDQTTATANPDGSLTVTDARPSSPATFTLPYSDFNVRSWRSNMVLRWEYRPGSTLYVVWQQNREADAPFGDLVSFGGLADPFRDRVGSWRYADPSVSHAMQNFFAVKLNYWLGL